MSKLSEVWQRVPLLLRRGDLDRELGEEIRIHLEMETEENIEAGMQPEEARQAAHRAFGNVTLVKENTREVWGFPALESFWQDLRYGVRMLGRSPGFTTVAVLSLALVIGANSTVFSVMNTILFQAFPFEEPNRLVQLSEIKVDQPNRRRWPTLSTFPEWSRQAQSFEEIALVAPFAQGATISARGQVETGVFLRVSPTFFPLLGVEPQLGRTFTTEDPSHEVGEPVLLSDSYWRRRFGADPNVLGERMVVEGQINIIVGVLPPGFRFRISPWSREPHVWQSINLARNEPRTGRFFVPLARLKPDITVEQARLELEAIARHLGEEDSAADESWRMDVQVLPDVLFAWWKESLFLLFGIALLVLLIACANVANLLLARAHRREKEISIRIALGASRLRLIRQLLTESILLSSLGGILGLLLTFWGIGLFVALAPRWWSLGQEQISIDARVIAFTAGVSLLTGVVFGLAPALRTSRPNLYESLKEGGRRSAGATGPRLRNLLIVSEVSLTVILLVGAGLMVHSFLNLQQEDPGYDPSNLLRAVDIWLQGPEYWERLEGHGIRVGPQADRFWEELLQWTEALPVVQSAAVSGYSWNWRFRFQIVGQAPTPPSQLPLASYQTISPGYFCTLGVPLLRGRTLTEHDMEGSRWVAVINETLARRFFPDEDPLGKRIQVDFCGGGGLNVVQEPLREIVGVAGDVRQNLASEPGPAVYVPHRQHLWEFPSQATAFSVTAKNLLLRVASRPLNLAPVVEKVIAEIDPDQVPGFITTEEQMLARVNPFRAVLDETIFVLRCGGTDTGGGWGLRSHCQRSQ